jgi:pimeloyl-ACP methyl ester carboxylesterase
VQSTTGTREVVALTVSGICLRGVHHKACWPSGDNVRNRRTGILLLNHGFLPKAAPGDSAVYWADALASSGYSCFRLDLPGLGDSDGEIPMPMLDFVNSGGYAPLLSAAVKELVQRFQLTGVVIVGHCASSVTALFTAAESKECKGVVLTDPYFFRVNERTEVLRQLGRWASWSRVGSFVRKLYVHVKHIPLALCRGRLPKNANWELLACWRQLTTNGVPILILKAPTLAAEGFKARTGEFDYLAYLQVHASPHSRTIIRYIEGTNHSFADKVGRAAVLEQTRRWLDSFFPITGSATTECQGACRHAPQCLSESKVS